MHFASRRDRKVISQYCGWPSWITSHRVDFQRWHTSHNHSETWQWSWGHRKAGLATAEHLWLVKLASRMCRQRLWRALTCWCGHETCEDISQRVELRQFWGKKGVKLGCICSSWLNNLYMHMATCLQPVSTVVHPFVKAMFLLETMRHCFKHLWGLWGVYVCVCICLHVYVCVWSDRWDLCCAERFF